MFISFSKPPDHFAFAADDVDVVVVAAVAAVAVAAVADGGGVAVVANDCSFPEK